MGKLRRFFESLAYAGLKPQSPGAAPDKPKDGWRERVERWINGEAPTDPLYLSNRTIWQRMRVVVVVLAPVLLLIAVLGLVFSGAFKGKDTPKPKELTVAEKAARILPGFDKPIQLPTNHDLDVQDVHVEHSSPRQVAGQVKNNTDHMISSAEMVFDLTDERGSRLGAVSTRLEKLPPHSTTPFRFAVAQNDADLVMVRDYQIR
jgi:hypothetical protein